MTAASLRDAAQHHLVVGDDCEAGNTRRECHQALGLGFAQDIVGEEDVVSDSGIGEHFGFAELLAGNTDGTRFGLHPGYRRNLVRLDMRAIGNAVPRHLFLRAGDIVFEPVEHDGDGRRIQVLNSCHGGLPLSLVARWVAGTSSDLIGGPAMTFLSRFVRPRQPMGTRSIRQPENLCHAATAFSAAISVSREIRAPRS